MSQPTLHAIVAISLLFVTPFAIADERFRHWYVGGGYGAYQLELDNVDFDEDEQVFRVLGGYRLNPYIAFEAEFQSLGDIDDDDDRGFDEEIRAEVYGLAVRPMLPLGKRVSLFGRLGYAYYELNDRARFLGIEFDEEELDSDQAFQWGGGIEVSFGLVAVRAEYGRVELKDTDLSVVTANVLFQF